MIRVHVICEGQTEETFINEVLMKPVLLKGVHLIPTLLGKPGHKGGNVKYSRIRTDIRARLLGEATAYCTTLFDFYALDSDFPGKSQALQQSTATAKSATLCQAFAAQLETSLGQNAMQRFIPYVQMYEFEALLFSDPDAFARGLCQDYLATSFQRIRQTFPSPEDINDGPETAPSKRVLKSCRQYEKPLHGTLAALEIGLDTIRSECQLFDAWLTRLESLSPPTANPPTATE